MFSFFTHLRISLKIMLGVGLFALLSVFIAAYGTNRLHSLSEKTNSLVSHEAEGVRLAGAVSTSENRIQQLWLLSVIEHDAADFQALVDQVGAENANIDKAIAQMQPLLDGEEATSLEKLKQGLAGYRAATAKIPPLWRQGRLDDAEDVLQHDSDQAFAQIDKAARQIVDAQRARLEAGAQEARSNAASSTSALIGVSLVGLLLIAGAVWLLVHGQVSKPLSNMTDLMGRLAGGDTTVDISGSERRDELGEMARAVLVFRDNARDQAATAAARAADQAEQKQVVETLADGLGKLAAGDLTTQIRADFTPAYAAVKTNFNEAVASLRELIGAVTQSADMIRTGSSEIAQASEDLARRTESNAASLEETSAAITQMDERLRATAQAAGRTVSRADQAISVVGSGRTVADEAVQAMTRVSDSAKGIDSVIEGLDKIAFQTRVLAMNAAVEAGRAGEAGRGFAVVADLVSALAMRAEEEAGRARDQLTTTQTEVVSAVEMVQKVDGALADISNNVSEVHQLLAQMATDNEAQSSAVTQISTAIGAMDQSTQQNAAMVEETAAAARNLTAEVSDLAAQAQRFTVAAGANAPAPKAKAPAATKTAQTVREKMDAPIKRLPAAAVPALRTTAAHDDDWQSF